MWHQLVDKSDSFVETSSSAMFVYGIARAVNKGYVEPRFAAVAAEGWKGLQSKIRADGQIEGVSLGVEPALPLTAFYRRETPLNEVIGIAAVLLAGSEILLLK
jgi:rhamnogalacturonyl hydrolase YesR